MIQAPGKHSPTVKNRSSKHLFFLTKRGIRQLNEWNKQKGIPEYKEPYHRKQKDGHSAKKPENDGEVK